MGEFRIERDSMGEMQVPSGAYYGASTQRAVLNFPVSGYRFGREFIRAMGATKHACAEANASLGKLDRKLAGWIQKAAREVFDGKLDDQFVLDIFQTGSGTSTNMNANEVIANRAIEIAGGDRFHADKPIHANDHVNMGQSTNDTFPTAIHVAVAREISTRLMPALEKFADVLAEKAAAWDKIIKIGRTHLADATPLRLGQEFGGFARQLELSLARAERALEAVLELPR